MTKPDPNEPPEAKVDRYISGVLDGSIVTGAYLKKAVNRHVADVKRARHESQTLGIASEHYFDGTIATAACEFFPLMLNHYCGEWAGEPFVLSDNQAFIVWCLWGWRRSDGTRRFRSAYITAARKWGKSTFCAGLMLLATVCDYPPEPGAENYVVATKEDQAKIVFNVAKAIRTRSPDLAELTQAQQRFIKALPIGPQPESILRPLGSDSDTSDGLNTHLTIMDELHAWKDQHQGLYDRMTTAAGSRRQPLNIIITTAGDENSEIWRRRHSASEAILDAAARGERTGENHFAFIAQLDPEDDPFDPEVWPKANPNMPTTPKRAYLEEQADECQHNATDRAKFKRFHCNVMVSASNKAIDPEKWKAAKGKLSDWATADYIGGGFDLGSYDDMAAAALVARFATGEQVDDKPVYRYEIKCQAWIDENSRRDLSVDPWATWVDNGDLTITTRSIQDIEEWILSSECDGVAYDPNNARRTGNTLADARGEEFAMSMPQLPSHYNEPIKEFLKALTDGRLLHDGDPVLSWAIGNLLTKPNNRQELMPVRPSNDAKIDPAVAVLMAFRMALFAETGSSEPMIY